MKQCDWLGPSPLGIQTPSRLGRIESDLSGLVLLKRDRCPEKLGLKLTGEPKHTVAQDLSIDSLKIPSPIKSVLRIDRIASRIADGGLAVSGRKKDPTMQMLETPAVLDPIQGEPIEQLGVGWRTS